MSSGAPEDVVVCLPVVAPHQGVGSRPENAATNLVTRLRQVLRSRRAAMCGPGRHRSVCTVTPITIRATQYPSLARVDCVRSTPITTSQLREMGE
jgi:hypothetical protein